MKKSFLIISMLCFIGLCFYGGFLYRHYEREKMPQPIEFFPVPESTPHTVWTYPHAATSKCLGNPKTPQCAIDTYIAGLIWPNTDHYFTAIGQNPDCTPDKAYCKNRLDEWVWPMMYNYTILASQTLTPEDIKTYDLSGEWQAGDTVVLSLEYLCDIPDSCRQEAIDDTRKKAHGALCQPTICKSSSRRKNVSSDYTTYVLYQKSDGNWHIRTIHAGDPFSLNFWMRI